QPAARRGLVFRLGGGRYSGARRALALVRVELRRSAPFARRRRRILGERASLGAPASGRHAGETPAVLLAACGGTGRGGKVAGGLPIVFPTISLGEVFLSPTSLMFRNLMAMDTEEMIRAQPMDAVVLVGGCDKTVPAQLMGAVSANRPAIGLVAGPMLTSRWH